MKRVLLAALQVCLKWLEKGRVAGIAHSALALHIAILTYINFVTFKAFLLQRSFWGGSFGYFFAYMVSVWLIFRFFLPKPYLLGFTFTPSELKLGKIVARTYFIASILLMVVAFILLAINKQA